MGPQFYSNAAFREKRRFFQGKQRRGPNKDHSPLGNFPSPTHLAKMASGGWFKIQLCFSFQTKTIPSKLARSMAPFFQQNKCFFLWHCFLPPIFFTKKMEANFSYTPQFLWNPILFPPKICDKNQPWPLRKPCCVETSRWKAGVATEVPRETTSIHGHFSSSWNRPRRWWWMDGGICLAWKQRKTHWEVIYLCEYMYVCMINEYTKYISMYLYT